ncbi:MAG: hypothetical protein CVU89_07375 [Firmicutes bacterium HGW-Firmicutes-14]|jgi:uridine phosphorylase|nr:MAG: hypothetical protein CVU89_07375 [Firmicutes bacterium HGW-Firmicutes-14]
MKKNRKKSPYPPPNVSVNYYTDPIYSSDAFYGYDENETKNNRTDEKKEAPDEPVESWGWVNAD